MTPRRPTSRRFPSAFRGTAALLLATAFSTLAQTTPPPPTPPAPLYESREATPDGTGRFFLGREIAQVMGHQGAPWLERPERVEEERPDLLHQLLRLQPGMNVADIGAGTGYHSWRMALAVGPTGKVHAVEIQQEMLDLLEVQMKRRGVTNVVSVLGTTVDPRLPADHLDLVLMVDVYHEFDHPYEMLAAITRSLRPGGQVAFVEFRGEQRSVPIKPLHKMTEAQIRKEAALHGLEWVATHKELPWQHLVLFRRPAPPSTTSPGAPSPAVPAPAPPSPR